MTLFARMILPSSGRARRVVPTLLVVVMAVALVWIGQASADKGGPGPDSISKTVAQAPTNKADAVDSTGVACTASPQFNDMPAMAQTFKLGGSASRPVIVLFQGMWGAFAPGLVCVHSTHD